LDLVKYLIDEKGADFNATDEDGRTSLHFAAESGNLDLVKYLEEKIRTTSRVVKYRKNLS
jgi:ankyrin repeat protein